MKITHSVFVVAIFVCQLASAQTEDLSKIARDKLVAEAQVAYQAKDFERAKILGSEFLRRNRKKSAFRAK